MFLRKQEASFLLFLNCLIFFLFSLLIYWKRSIYIYFNKISSFQKYVLSEQLSVEFVARRSIYHVKRNVVQRALSSWDENKGGIGNIGGNIVARVPSWGTICHKTGEPSFLGKGRSKVIARPLAWLSHGFTSRSAVVILRPFIAVGRGIAAAEAGVGAAWVDATMGWLVQRVRWIWAVGLDI